MIPELHHSRAASSNVAMGLATRPRIGGQVAPTLAEPMDASVNEASRRLLGTKSCWPGDHDALANCAPRSLPLPTAPLDWNRFLAPGMRPISVED
jgi:hypothetical protein